MFLRCDNLWVSGIITLKSTPRKTCLSKSLAYSLVEYFPDTHMI